jgi:plastocyanin
MLAIFGPKKHGPVIHRSPTIPRRQFAVSAWGVILFLTLLTAQVHAHVALDSPNGGEVLETGSVAQIVWHDTVNHGPATYDLWYSISGPEGPWIIIDSGLERSESTNTTYDWVVPDTPSDQVRLQVLQDNFGGQDYTDISDSDLAIVKSSTGLQVVLEAERDATIYEDGNGTNANGSGIYLFTGRAEAQNASAERRGLLVFPITDAIPEGSTITSASLDLTMSRTRSGGQTVGLHRLLEDWSEGPSDPTGQEGGGTTAVAGDVTWLHREFSGTLWSTPGASFAQSASATMEVANEGSYSYSSTPELVADVQGWLDDPSSNFGWALVVDSAATGSAKRFNSRENGTASSRPKLTIEYEADLEGPTAGFSFTPAHPRPGDEVRFSDESTGEPTSWLWDFGDGQTSQDTNPSHTYTTSGSKTVTLVVSNASGSDSAVKEVRISSPPRRPSRRVVPNR